MANREIEDILGIDAIDFPTAPAPPDNLETDLIALHDSIVQQIKEKFPDFQTVEFYRDDECEFIPTPACLLEMDEFEPSGENHGTEQLEVALRFTARIIFSREKTPNAPLQVRMAALYLTNLINQNAFSGHISPAEIVRAGPDPFRPDLEGRFEVWSIEWAHHRAIFGRNVWNVSIIPIQECYGNDELVYERDDHAC